MGLDDNFNEIKINRKFYSFLKKKVKICIVSPELVKKVDQKKLKKLNLI